LTRWTCKHSLVLNINISYLAKLKSSITLVDDDHSTDGQSDDEDIDIGSASPKAASKTPPDSTTGEKIIDTAAFSSNNAVPSSTSVPVTSSGSSLTVDTSFSTPPHKKRKRNEEEDEGDEDVDDDSDEDATPASKASASPSPVGRPYKDSSGDQSSSIKQTPAQMQAALKAMQAKLAALQSGSESFVLLLRWRGFCL
jgi:hypothetical protein